MAEHRHKRVTRSRLLTTTVSKTTLASGSVALVAIIAAVTVGVVYTSAGPASLTAGDPTPTGPTATSTVSTLAAVRPPDVSRDLSRNVGRGGLTPRQDAVAATELRAQRTRDRAARERRLAAAATARAVTRAHTSEWTTSALDVWSASADGSRRGEIGEAKKVLVTGRRADGRTEIVVDRQSRWVTSGYLSADKPLAAASGLSMAPCPDGGVENGLTSGAVYVYRSVCHAFPQITSYGGYAPRGEHASGKALDIMTSDVELGTAIAEFLQTHASELDLYDIIWRQHIWTPVRASEGWRSMSDRGSETANHYDHVHVSVN